MNHILEVSTSGKAPKTKIGTYWAMGMFGQNLDKKIVLLTVTLMNN